MRTNTISARLCLLFTPDACHLDPWATLERALRAGVDLVQWRVKHRDRDGACRALATCRDTGVPMIVNDDAELAAEIGADGVHVGQDDLAAPEARRLIGPSRWLGVSTHDDEELRRALADGADYVGFGPMFPTATKGYSTGQPDAALRAALELAADTPVFAIGGVTPGNVGRLLQLGARHVAVSRSILGANDPAAAAAALRRALDQTSSIASPNE